MEAILRNQVMTRKEALADCNKQVDEIMTQCREGGVNETEFIKTKLRLKQLSEAYEKEASRLTSVATEDLSVQLLKEGLTIQMKAESNLVEMEATSHIIKQNTPDCTTVSARLPKLELSKFSGDILKWSEFWDRFTSNIDTQSLTNVDKLAYLMGSLEGRARETVEGISITNDNYSVVVELLKARYGSRERVIDAHYKELSKITKCKDNANETSSTIDKIERHLRVLDSLGENIESNHLRTLILEKFPERVLYEVTLRTPEPRTVLNIRKALRNVITAMELSQGSDTTRHVPVNAPTASSTEALHIRTEDQQFHKNSRQSRKQEMNTGARANTNNKNKKTRKRKMEGNDKTPDTKKRRQSCIFCEGDHYNDECSEVKDLKARREKLKGRCFNCFRDTHVIKDCKRPKRCYYCHGPHNRALCTNRSMDRLVTSEPTKVMSGPSSNHVSFLQTATAKVLHTNRERPCRILLDCGSQRSYITTNFAKLLALTPIKEELLMIFTFGSAKPTETLSPCTEITLQTKRGIQRKIKVNIVPHITDRVPIPQIDITDEVDVLAEDGLVGQGIDILIGNDYYFSFLRNEKMAIFEDLYLVDSDFGWILSGSVDKTDEQQNEVLSVITYHHRGCELNHYTEPDLPLRNLDVKFLWSLENIGITDSIKATREEEAVQHFNKTVEYQEGRYHVKWPWLNQPLSLPINYGLAYGRLKGLLQRLDKPTLQEYDDILKEQLQAKIIEIIEPECDLSCQTTPPRHYLPHHIVKQAGKRGRVVYDASAKMKEQLSLNECMFRGPCMLQDLTALLINFRINRIGILADVEKAFLQVGLQTEDRDVTRFVWVKNINEPLNNNNILHLRFCRVPFGVIASPFLLTATIRYHILKTNEDLLEPIANKCYVDNLVTGTNSTEEAVKLFQDARETFSEISMNIRDWTSNDEALMKKIPEQSRAKPADDVKVLGLLWNKVNDTLRLNINEEIFDHDEHKRINKREVLRILASIYDPCGYASPILLLGKLLLQELWRRGYNWNTPLSPDLLQEWKKVISMLRYVKDVNVPRYIGVSAKNQPVEYELHCFTDASQHSYAAIAYLRANNGFSIKTALVMSKTRVTPLEKRKKTKSTDKVTESKPQLPSDKIKKPMTIPQLELLGYVIGNRLLSYLRNSMVIPIAKQYLWTDSLIVLNWVKSNKLLPPFVANRVEEIKRSTEVEMCYINTKQNPADVATRPELWAQRKQLWLHGPTFLLKKREMWPKDMYLQDHQTTVSVVAEGPEVLPLDVTEDNENHVTQEVTEEINDTGDTGDQEMQLTSINQDSEVQEIKDLQYKYFPEEIKGKETHLTRNLGLFMDVDGLLRCKGRMMHTDWSYDMKHPILLPKDCEFTTVVIRNTHEKNYHVGVSHTLSIIRKRYWIPQGRSQVQKIVRRCPQCVKHGGGPYQLPMTPALPPERVNYSAPYTYIGLDYFGPMVVKTTNGREKRWICLITCLVIRAIYLEVVKDLTAEECLLALRRFVASRGVPTLILSDNALQFRLTSEVMTNTYCIQNKIKWRFIPQLAPWHGGVYERLVAVVKNCLKRTLDKHLLEDSQLQTVIKEVEAVVNTRPLTCVGADLDYVLKPADFLSLGKCLTMESTDVQTVPEGTATKRDLVEGWRRGQHIMNEFKDMFVGQYLPSLRERYKQSQKQPRVTTKRIPCVGDIVQIKGESKNRQNWKVGSISSLIKGKDGECRVAKVKVGSTEFTRSIGHLYPLEADIDNVAEKEAFQDRSASMTDASEPRIMSPRQEQLMDVEEIDDNVDVAGDNKANEVTEPISDVDLLEISIPEESNQESEAVEPPILQHEETIAGEVERRKRVAAVKAREKIAEWTRQLFASL